MDIFESKNISPMLISEMREPFDSQDYIYELKLDGIRCLAFLDEKGTVLLNKRNLLVAPIYPELKDINKQVRKRCILDGEIVVINNGKPDFSEIQRRSLMTNKIKIDLASSKLPVSFIAFDILYYNDKQITDMSLMERKESLQAIIEENEKLAVSRYIEKNGIDFYNLTVKENLEGIVAKLKDSKYYIGKRTKDWIKIKNLQDDDFVVCGYILKENNVTSIILGQYSDNELIYKGHVTLGVSTFDFNRINSEQKISYPYIKEIPIGNENAVWIEPNLVCTVKYMTKTQNGGLRQPVFKGLRHDKEPKECVIRVDL